VSEQKLASARLGVNHAPQAAHGWAARGGLLALHARW